MYSIYYVIFSIIGNNAILVVGTVMVLCVVDTADLRTFCPFYYININLEEELINEELCDFLLFSSSTS